MLSAKVAGVAGVPGFTVRYEGFTDGCLAGPIYSHVPISKLPDGIELRDADLDAAWDAATGSCAECVYMKGPVGRMDGAGGEGACQLVMSVVDQALEEGRVRTQGLTCHPIQSEAS